MKPIRTRSDRAEAVRRHRGKLRALGLRPVQIWLPDTRAPGFAEECRRQSLLAAADRTERALMDSLEAMQDRSGWEA